MNPTDTRWKVAAEVSQSRAHSEAVRLLKEVKPTTRKRVFVEIASRVHQFPLLVEYFRARIYSPYNSKPGLYHPEDAFGDAFWAWKEWYDISDTDSKWEDMSTDETFRKLLERAVLDAVQKGAVDISGEDLKDYHAVSLKAKALHDAVQKLDRSGPTEDRRNDALRLAKEVLEMLSR